MDQQAWEAWIAQLDNVVREESWGYSMFYVGDERMVPFVSIAASDSDYDSVSNLNRAGVFRLNIGVGRANFSRLFPDGTPSELDYTTLNTLLPHPEYAAQNYVCILNPVGDMIEETKALIADAHNLVSARMRRTRG